MRTDFVRCGPLIRLRRTHRDVISKPSWRRLAGTILPPPPGDQAASTVEKTFTLAQFKTAYHVPDRKRCPFLNQGSNQNPAVITSYQVSAKESIICRIVPQITTFRGKVSLVGSKACQAALTSARYHLDPPRNRQSVGRVRPPPATAN